MLKEKVTPRRCQTLVKIFLFNEYKCNKKFGKEDKITKVKKYVKFL